MTSRWKNLSRGTNSRLPFAVNGMLKLSNVYLPVCKSAAAFVAHRANRHAALQPRGIEVSAEVDIFRYGGVVLAYFLCYVQFIPL